MKEARNFSYLFGSNAPYIEELYESYLDNPQSVEATWQRYFADLAATSSGTKDVASGSTAL